MFHAGRSARLCLKFLFSKWTVFLGGGVFACLVKTHPVFIVFRQMELFRGETLQEIVHFLSLEKEHFETEPKRNDNQSPISNGTGRPSRAASPRGPGCQPPA